MTLRRKTLLSVGLLIITLTLVLYAFSRAIILRGFADLEAQQVAQAVAQVQNAFLPEQLPLQTLVRDWASWDDTYQFIVDRNPEYIVANLEADTFSLYHLDVILYLDAQGSSVYAYAFDAVSAQLRDVPASLQAQITGNTPLFQQVLEGEAITGLLLLPEGPLLISAAPIRTSLGAGPNRGVLLMGRMLDASRLTTLNETALIPFALLRYDDSPVDFSSETPIVVQPLDSQTVRGYGLLYDLHEQPALVVQVELSRDIYRQGQRSVSYLLFSSLFVGLLLGAVMLWLLEKPILGRLSYLSRAVERIGDDVDLSGRIFLKGDDELASLANAINRMLVIIQLAQVERDQNAEILQQYNETLAQLNRLGQRLAASLNRSQIAEELSKTASKIIGAQSVSVWLADAEGGVTCWASSDAPGDARENNGLLNFYLPPGVGVVGWVQQHGHGVISNNPAQDTRFFSGVDKQIGYQSKDLLAVPLQLHGQTVGVLELVNKIHGQFTAEDLSLVELLAVSVVVALDNAALIEQLRDYTVELETQNAELDAFAHTVAHDLKGPVSVLVGFAGLVKMRVAELTHDELLHAMQRIEQNAYKSNVIINELLLLASVRKMEDLVAVPLQMGGIVNDALNRLLESIAQADGELRMPDVWPSCMGYPAWIEEVWVNYISNAIKYGGEAPVVELGATVQSNGFVRYWVRDQGKGLLPEEQARLFVPFERLDQTRVKGHGLGLSIVRRIVEKLGGHVGVDSVRGQGCTFWFELPRLENRE